jgi:hypothetical protein
MYNFVSAHLNLKSIMLVDIFKGYGWQYIGEESGA